MTTPTVQPSYATYNTITITLASLGTSSTFVAGEEATAVDNTTTLYDDVTVTGKITTGTTPTSGTLILIYAFERLDDAPTWPDVFTGSDSARTLTSVGVGQGFLRQCAALQVDSNTTARAYPFTFQLAQFFGGRVPKFWSLFVTHNTGVNLNATPGNHVVEYRGVNDIIPSI